MMPSIEPSAAPSPPGIASPNRQRLDEVVVGRAVSFVAADFASARPRIAATLNGTRVLVIGGGGSIGGATVQLLSTFRPRAIHVIDASENYLADLVRNLRGRTQGLEVEDFRTLPLNYGSPLMRSFLEAAEPYDTVLNFAALKHVRSEKDVYSLLQMIDTNVVCHARFKRWLRQYQHACSYFAVSTDKAANPTSVMGASKRLMEDVTFAIRTCGDRANTSARFANVAYSNGSLSAAFLERLARRQPLAAPRDTSRYFMTQGEAAEICVLAALAVPDGMVLIPRLDPRSQLRELGVVAEQVLHAHGLRAVHYEDESAARRDVERLARHGAWPLLLTPLDTSGEKPYEEFVGHAEHAEELGFAALLGIRHLPGSGELDEVLEVLERMVTEPAVSLRKQDVVALISRAVPHFQHVETGRDLDQRL
jgi:FlaA1/EpsC-like NDP-sugar epimerase